MNRALTRMDRITKNCAQNRGAPPPGWTNRP
jgi:hypothetical protein